MLFGKLLPPPPSWPTLPHSPAPPPGRERWGPPQRRPAGGGDSGPNPRSSSETSLEKEWEPPLEPLGQQGPLASPGVCFQAPGSRLPLPRVPWAWPHQSHPWHSPWTVGWGWGWEDVTSHICRPGLASRALLPSPSSCLPIAPPHLLDLHRPQSHHPGTSHASVQLSSHMGAHLSAPDPGATSGSSFADLVHVALSGEGR